MFVEDLKNVLQFLAIEVVSAVGLLFLEFTVPRASIGLQRGAFVEKSYFEYPIYKLRLAYAMELFRDWCHQKVEQCYYHSIIASKPVRGWMRTPKFVVLFVNQLVKCFVYTYGATKSPPWILSSECSQATYMPALSPFGIKIGPDATPLLLTLDSYKVSEENLTKSFGH